MDDTTPKLLDNSKCKEIGGRCACYNLRRASRAITRLYDDHLRPSGLRTTQVALLMSTKFQGPVTLTKLAELTVTERTTLTRNLTVLEKKGFVRIEPGSDRRERQVTLTRQGEEALLAALPLWEKAQSHIECGIGKDRLGRFMKDLSKIVSLARRS